MTDKKALKLEDMNAAEYRRHLQQQSAELRSAAIKATGDVQATIEHAPEAARAKAKEVLEAPLVPLADERRVTPNMVGNVQTEAPAAAPKSEPVSSADNGKSTADTNPPEVKQTTVSDDKSKK